MSISIDKKFNATLNKEIVGEVLFFLHKKIDILDLLTYLDNNSITYLQDDINDWVQETLQDYSLMSELTDIIVSSVTNMIKQYSTIEKVVETKEVIKFTL